MAGKDNSPLCRLLPLSAAMEAMRRHPLGREAAEIGEVLPPASHVPRVTLRTMIGGERVLEMPYGEDLPRIC